MYQNDQRTLIEIRNRFLKTYHFRTELSRIGFHHRKGEIWEKYTNSDGEIEEAKKFARKNLLRCVVLPYQERRSSDYRKDFFETHPGLFKKGLYQCVYCGKILTKEETTVDHFVSIASINQKNALYALLNRKILSAQKIENINDPKNLVPACKKCNQKKGSKTGLWLFKGWIGRYFWVWVIRWILKFCLIAIAVYLLYRLSQFI